MSEILRSMLGYGLLHDSHDYMTALYIMTASRLCFFHQTFYYHFLDLQAAKLFAQFIKHETALIGMRGRLLSCAGLRQTITVIYEPA